jgi:peptide-methionine (R)-S-oxide reductase
MIDTKKYNEEFLKKTLSKEQYDTLVNKGTEYPFTGKYLNNKEPGMYVCPVCGTELFSSETKFDSGSGWPSFYDIANNKSVKLIEDHSLGMERTEVTCATCGSHLGHLFNDAVNQPTGLRYCINSTSLEFKPTHTGK